jgi:hypothetical protein
MPRDTQRERERARERERERESERARLGFGIQSNVQCGNTILEIVSTVCSETEPSSDVGLPLNSMVPVNKITITNINANPARIHKYVGISSGLSGGGGGVTGGGEGGVGVSSERASEYIA